jgi:hypothetical protein
VGGVKVGAFLINILGVLCLRIHAVHNTPAHFFQVRHYTSQKYQQSSFRVSYATPARMQVISFGAKVSNTILLLSLCLILCFHNMIVASFQNLIEWILLLGALALCFAIAGLMLFVAIAALDVPQLPRPQKPAEQTRAERGMPWQKSCLGPKPIQPSRKARRQHQKFERKRQQQEEKRYYEEEKKFYQDENYHHQQASGESEWTRFEQKEQKHNFEDAHYREQQAVIVSASTIKAFSKWREQCRTQLQAPERITRIPCPPEVTCPDIACKMRISSVGICSHGLKKLYEDSKLEEKDLKDELKLWHPNGAKVNQVRENCKIQVLGMANEIAHALQEILKDI